MEITLRKSQMSTEKWNEKKILEKQAYFGVGGGERNNLSIFL